MSKELQYELELIGEYVYRSENNILNESSEEEEDDEEEKKPLKVLRVPELGKIGVEAYNLPAMPIPEMVNIDGVRFDFRNSIRNPDYR